jgi:hypothetical protein
MTTERTPTITAYSFPLSLSAVVSQSGGNGWGPGRIPAMSGSSSPLLRAALALSSLDCKRRACFCCCFSCRALSLARFWAVGLVDFDIFGSPFSELSVLTANWSLGFSAGNHQPDSPNSFLDLLDVYGLQTFLPLRDREFHALSLFQRFITFHLDRRMVHKDVFSRIALNKPVPFVVFEPLYSSLLSHVFFLKVDNLQYGDVFPV